MAYDRRITELQSNLDKSATSAGGANEPAVTTMRKAIADYAGIRSSALDDLAVVIDNVVVGTTGVQSRWKSRVDSARAKLDEHFGNAVKDVLLPAPLQMFWDATVRFERTFFEQLGTVRTPQFVEDLLKHQGILASTIVDLEGNWKDVLYNDSSLDNEEMNTVRELDRLIQNLVNDIEAEHKAIVSEMTVKLMEKTREAVEKAKEEMKRKLGEKPTIATEMLLKVLLALLKDELGEAKDGVEEILERIKAFMEKLAYFSRAYRDRAAEYRRLMSIEKGGVLTMFKGKREEVARYERDNNLVIAQIWRDEAKRDLTKWADALVSEQRGDAEEFNRKIFDIIDKNWKVTEAMDGQFRSKFAGIFTAPLTTDTIETLTEGYMFRRAIDDVNGRAAAGKIDDARRLLAGAVDETVDKAGRNLADLDTDWPEELKQAARLENEEFKRFAQDRLKSQIDTALNYLGELRVLLDPLNVLKEFSREELEAMLR